MQHDESIEPLISIAAAAKEVGVNRSTLLRQVSRGEIRSHGGKVRLSEVLTDRIANIDLTRSRRRRGEPDDVASADATESDATPADATEAVTGMDADWVEVDGQPMPYREARRLKEIYLARLRQLEFEKKAGEVASVDAAVKEVTREFSIVREHMLGLPGQIAPQLCDRSQAEIEAALRKKITEILENLSDPRDVAEIARKAAMN